MERLKRNLTSALSRMLISLRFIRTSQAGCYTHPPKKLAFLLGIDYNVIQFNTLEVMYE